MDANVVWQGRMTFTGTADTGFTVPLGADPSVGGDNDGFRPLELLAVGMAGCTAMDVLSILRKKRMDVTAFEVRVHADRADEHPKVFTRMTVEYIVTGRNIKPEGVQRAIELSEQIYCPAQGMLGKAVPIVSTFTIHEVE